MKTQVPHWTTVSQKRHCSVSVDNPYVLSLMSERLQFIGSGDVWEEGEMMRLLKGNLAQRNEDNRLPYDNMLQVGQVRPELVVMDPNDA